MDAITRQLYPATGSRGAIAAQIGPLSHLLDSLHIGVLDEMARIASSAGINYHSADDDVWSNRGAFFSESGAPLNSAKVIFVGEDHWTPAERFANQVLIAHLAKPGDIVLAEGYNAGEVISKEQRQKDPRLQLLRPGLWVMGWDSLAAVDTSGPLFGELYDDPPVLRGPDVSHYGIFSVGSKDAVEAFQRLAAQHALTRDIQLSVVERNRALIESIRRARAKSPDAKIFIISGWGHYFGDPKESGELVSYLKSIDAAAVRPGSMLTQMADQKAYKDYLARIGRILPHRELMYRPTCKNRLFEKEIPYSPSDAILGSQPEASAGPAETKF